MQRVQDWLVAPIYGLGTMAVLLPVAGLIGLGLLMITGETLDETDPTNDDLLASIALIGGLLANGGFWLVSLGAGAAMGSRGEEVDGPTTVESHHLPYFADDDPGLWAAPVVMIAFLLVATYVVARKSPAHRVLANLGVWVAVVLVTTPLFVRVSSLHARMDVPGRGLPRVRHDRGRRLAGHDLPHPRDAGVRVPGRADDPVAEPPAAARSGRCPRPDGPVEPRSSGTGSGAAAPSADSAHRRAVALARRDPGPAAQLGLRERPAPWPRARRRPRTRRGG